jgi:hypothetical protein
MRGRSGKRDREAAVRETQLEVRDDLGLRKALGRLTSDVPMVAWVDRFLDELKTYYQADKIIAAIRRDPELAHLSGVLLRFYVNPNISGPHGALGTARKQRGRAIKQKLRSAVTGLEAAAEVYTSSGRPAIAQELLGRLTELRGIKDRTAEAFRTKSHGRDRSHSTLAYARRILELRLGCSITYATLASLVNAAYQADGQDTIVTEETVRKNLTNLGRNAPNWVRALDASFPRKP